MFAGWLVFRTALWTLIALTQPHPPLDTVEWLNWGRTWQAGYHKHPPLAAWLAALASWLTPGSFLGIYLAGYLFIALALWCVWKLASEVLPPRTALAATVCLDGLIYFTRDAGEFNNQVVLAGFWALTVWCFWRAIVTDDFRWWIGTGAALGLALWCKYSAVFLAVPLCALWLWQNRWRRLTRPLIVALVASVVLAPHLVWLIQHDFPTLRYASMRVQGESQALDHRLSGITFLGSQIVRLAPVALILLPVLRRKPGAPATSRSFLLTVVLGPVVLHLAVSLLLGMQLRDIWGMPLWTFAGVCALCLLGTTESDRRWRWLWIMWAAVSGVLALATLAGNLAGGGFRDRPRRIHYPGETLSRALCSRWQQRFGTPLPIVAGDAWLAGCVCVHASHRPTLYPSREPAFVGLDRTRLHRDPARFIVPDSGAARWTSDADLLTRGGVLVWDAAAFGDKVPRWLKKRFAGAEDQPPLVLPLAGGSRHTLRAGWAILPPAESE
jgi:4-amino-4-deoxy-L-arabinose transferase-like glycosyltransferase